MKIFSLVNKWTYFFEIEFERFLPWNAALAFSLKFESLPLFHLLLIFWTLKIKDRNPIKHLGNYMIYAINNNTYKSNDACANACATFAGEFAIVRILCICCISLSTNTLSAIPVYLMHKRARYAIPLASFNRAFQ